MNVLLHRIIHIENLEFIVNAGEIRCKNHTEKDDNYIGIGDNSLIEKRSIEEIEIGPQGTFNDYVSFYFGPRSPMLYSIKHGYNGVKKRNQSDIIYLVTSTELIAKAECRYVFFDGHGYHKFSRPYDDLNDLSNVDWQAVRERYWRNTEHDPDLKRRKQAEFLVHQVVPFDLIRGIAVYNGKAENTVQEILQDYKYECTVKIKKNYYY